jgi:hypothetical protein
MAKETSGESAFLDDDEKQVRGLLDYVTSSYQTARAEIAGKFDHVAAAHKRIQEIDREIERIRPIYEEGLTKRGKPRGRWFDEGRAYSVWLLAHTEWARRSGAGMAVDFQVPKNVTARELITLAKQMKWDPLPVRLGGADLFLGEAKTLEQSISRGRKTLSMSQGWQSAICEGIFRKLFEYRANDKRG